jgi:hypothetical protein
MASREEINATIIERAAADPALRAQFIADPRATLESVTGVAIPEGVSITVHEESPSNIHFVIPAVGDLSEADLALVAGGLWTQNYSGGVNQDPF